ncbi:hypothetical protein IQ216_05480 [Cyanobium sp. LEGE 06143]|uniref:hypothetical protein n=1 Tax=Cyanobium sp. LEGE 06143 TaxID=945727 RepID=UPI0018807261|nr:hypothetical protein [Cyanobium sp. LEGE 06143]MBE9172555.1 hypothetical protein [Cyanobium sp. LEGE 06143]
MAPTAYYPIQRRWRRLGPLYRSRETAAIWWPELEAYSEGRAEEHGYPYEPTAFIPGLLPADYDACDWRWSHGRRGPQPTYWGWVCHGACHWTASLHLWAAMQAESDRPWRIVTSSKH